MSSLATANGGGQPQTPRAVVIDAGVGNLGNLERALRSLGAAVEVTDRPEPIAAARCLLLPGVGAFRPPRERLRGALEQALRAALDRGAHLLGICVGYQLLFGGSDEFGSTDGLALIEGSICRLPDTVPLPHIGWNSLEGLSPHPLLAGIEEGSYAYFVHSFAPDGVPAAATLASALHGRRFAAVAGAGRVLGTQFHPEKSAEIGLRLLANFLEISAS
jgi:glutamine amidotransferase